MVNFTSVNMMITLIREDVLFELHLLWLCFEIFLMKEQKHGTCLKCNRLLLIFCIKLKSYHIYNCAHNQGKLAILI